MQIRITVVCHLHLNSSHVSGIPNTSHRRTSTGERGMTLVKTSHHPFRSHPKPQPHAQGAGRGHWREGSLISSKNEDPTVGAAIPFLNHTHREGTRIMLGWGLGDAVTYVGMINGMVWFTLRKTHLNLEAGLWWESQVCVRIRLLLPKGPRRSLRHSESHGGRLTANPYKQACSFTATINTWLNI